jgi:hypothetical protein
MRLSSLFVAAFLLFSTITFAQHSSGGGGGGNSGGSSGSGSHGDSSGGSSYSSSSGGSHSSGGSGSSSSAHSSSGSAPHGSSAHSSIASPASSHSNVSTSQSNRAHPVHEPNTNVRTRTETTEKRGFFSLLRHPFRKPEPKPEPKKVVADLRRPVCFKGPCPVCPVGQARVGGGCTGTVTVDHTRSYCSSGEVWSGGACLQHTRFLDDCAGLRMTMLQQMQRMQSAESVRQSACAAGPTQSCTDLTNASQSESGLYRTLQERYRMCLQQRPMTAYPFGNFAFRGYWAGGPFESWQMGLSFP